MLIHQMYRDSRRQEVPVGTISINPSIIVLKKEMWKRTQILPLSVITHLC